MKKHLDHLYATFDRDYLSTDPLEFLHRLDRPDDVEIFGFYAAGLAYGRVRQIKASLEDLLRRMGPRPADFVRGFDVRKDRRLFDGFVHRFHGPDDMAILTELLRRALAEAGTLGAWFERGFHPGDPDAGPGLADFSRRMTGRDDLPAVPGLRRGRLPSASPVRLFFSSPSGGSACKRLNLYLRWMVRRDGGLDFGLWRGITPAHLIIPLDTHVARIATYIGLTSRRSPGWRMAREVTAGLRELDPLDPVKYDFALCRLGILDHCPRRRDPVKCARCLLQPVCTL